MNNKYQKVLQQRSTNNFDVNVVLADYDMSAVKAPAQTMSKTYDVTYDSGYEAVLREEIISGRSVKVRGSVEMIVEKAICIAIT